MISNPNQAMTQRLQQAILLIQSLPASTQDQLATLLMNAIEKANLDSMEGTRENTLIELTEKALAGIPEYEWSKLPADLATEHDHYLYGSPKRNQ